MSTRCVLCANIGARQATLGRHDESLKSQSTWGAALCLAWCVVWLDTFGSAPRLRGGEGLWEGLTVPERRAFLRIRETDVAVVQWRTDRVCPLATRYRYGCLVVLSSCHTFSPGQEREFALGMCASCCVPTTTAGEQRHLEIRTIATIAFLAHVSLML